MKKSKKILISCITLILCTLSTVGCTNKSQGTMWYVENTDPNSSYSANVGDMYLNSTTDDLFQLTESGWNKIGNIQGQAAEIIQPDVEISADGYWIIDGQKTDKKAIGEDGKDGQDGKDNSGGKNGKDGKNGQDGKDGVNGTNGKDGIDGKDGVTPTIEIGNNGNWFINGEDSGIKVTGANGTSIYVGYDNYIWNGNVKTNYKVKNTEQDNSVVESTINIKGTMSEYFETKYIDLSKDSVALMSYYMPNAKMTLYSGVEVKNISLYSEKDGTITIGTAKVEDVVNARTNGTTYTSSTKIYNVTKGLNNIELNIYVKSNETIVLGGNNSVGILYAKEINTNDEQGIFTLLNSKSNSVVEEKTNNIEDKLVIEVKADLSGEEKTIFSDIKTAYPDSIVVSMAEYQYNGGNPYTYSTKNYYSGKKITKIGAPIKSVNVLDENQFYTICIMKQSNAGAGAGKHTCEKTYKIYLPIDELTNTTVNKWIYVDVSDLNIVVGIDETLAFSANGDTAIIGYDNVSGSSIYNFYTNSSAIVSQQKILWDIYYKENITLSNHIANLKSKDSGN